MYLVATYISNCLCCFVFSQCSMNHPFTGNPTEENNLAWNLEWIRVSDDFLICWNYTLRTLVDELQTM